MTTQQLMQQVTDKIVALLKEEKIPWRRPWGSSEIMSLPVNAKTKAPYQGINIMLLWLQEQPSPYWATEKVWTDLGAYLIEGELPTRIFFYTFFNGKNNKRVPFLREYNVYNLWQVRGCDYLRMRASTRIQADFAPAEQIITNSQADIRVSKEAYYDISEDVIYCPPRRHFHSMAGYYTTKLHELSHWTGNAKRLNRVFGVARKTPEYAFEELIAELSSCFLSAYLEIPEALDEMPQH